MSSSNYQIHNLALEEASEGRRSAKGTRNNVSRSQSPKNSMIRQSTTPKSNSIFGSPQRNVYAQQDFNNLSSKAGVTDFRSSPNAQYPASYTPPPNDNSGNNNLTVDFLLQKVDDLLKQSQTPVKPQFNQQARQEAPSYSQANPFVQSSSPSGLRQSITLEGKPRKNEIFVKKSYEVPRDSNSLMTNPAKDLQAPRQVESKNELFPIRESMRNSTLSIGPTRSPNRDDIQSDMGDIRSRLNNLENQLNAVGTTSRYNNSTYNDPYVTPRGQSVPPLRTDSLYSAPPTQSQHETTIKSPYTGGDYLSYSVEKPNNRPAYIETNPKLDAEVSEQICQTIDNLIQTHLLDNRSPSKSTLMSQRTYTSPTKTYNPSTQAPLYKSSILPNAEPYHKSTPPPYSSSAYNNYQPSTYEPTYSVYESRYDTTLPKYEPYRPYEPLQSYETKSAYEPYETRSRYDPVPSYDRDLRSPPSYTSSYNQGTLTAGDYDGSLSSRTNRPKYVRPLHRNSPPRYGDYQNNWSASGSKYISPRSNNNDYFNKQTSSGLSTPKRDNPYSHQDTSSTDRKMKKLTLKSKVSEEKDYDRMELPRQNYARKGAQRQSFRSSDLLPDHDDNERLAYGKNKPSFKSGDMISDNESHKSDNVNQNRTTQKKVRAAPTQAQAQATERIVSQKKTVKKMNGVKDYKAGDLEDDDDRKSDNTPHAIANDEDAIGELVDDSEGEEWEEREEREEVDHAQERERERERVREKAKEYEREKEREKERERVKEQERQRLRQSQKVTRNVDDDGKSWNMVHKVPNSMFEDADNSFDFNVTEPKQRQEAEENRKNVVRASNTVKPKSSLQQQPPRKDSGKAMIWAMEEPLARSQRQSMSDLSDSIRRTEKKPVISHVFEKSGRHAY